MAASLSVTLSLDAAAFTDGLKRAQDAGKNLADAVKSAFANVKISIGTESVEQSLDGLKRRAEDAASSLQKSFSGASTFAQSAFGFNQIQQSVERIAATAQTLSAPFVELDTSLRNIGALGVKNFAEFEGLVVGLSKTIPDSAAVIGDAIAEAVGSGVIAVENGRANIQQASEFIQVASKLAIAGNTDIQTAVKGLASTLNSYSLSTSEANRVSDVIFNTFNYGVSSVKELSKYLYEITPTAAGLGVSLEQVGGALATMTKQGIRTTVATDRLRSFLVALQKPNKELAAVMERSGVTLQGFRDGTLTMQEAAKRISYTTKELGLNTNQIFASVEAASAVMFLGGKNAEKAMIDLKNVSQRNTVKEGFDVQAQGIESRVRVMINTINAGFIEMFGKVGTGATVALNTTARLAPTLTALASVKQLVPEGAFTSLSNGITGVVGKVGNIGTAFLSLSSTAGAALQKTSASLQSFPATVAATVQKGFAAVPGVLAGAVQTSLASIRAFPAQATSAFSTLGAALAANTQTFLASSRSLLTGALPAMQSFGASVATGLVSAFKNPLGTLKLVFAAVGTGARAMWAAVTGPVGLVIAAIAAVAAIGVALYDNFDDIKQAVNEFVTNAIEVFNELKPVFFELLGVVRQVGGFLYEYLKTPFEIITTIVRAFTGEAEQASGTTKDLGSSVQGAGQQTSFFKQALQTVLQTLINIKGTIGGVTEAFKTIKEVIGEAFRAMSNFNIKGVIEAFSGSGAKIAASYDKGWNQATQAAQTGAQAQKDAAKDGVKGQEEAATEFDNITKKSVSSQVAEFKKLAFTLTPEQLKGRRELLEFALKSELEQGKISQQQYYKTLSELVQIEQAAIKKFKGSSSGSGRGKKESFKDQEELLREARELERLREQILLEGLAETQRKLKEFDIKASDERAKLERDIKKAEFEKKGSLSEILRKQEAELLKRQAIERNKFLNELALKEVEGTDKARDEAVKRQIELLKVQEQLLRGADEASIRERGRIRLQILDLQAGQELDKLLEVNETYKKAAIEFNKVKLTGDTSEIAQAQAAFDTVRNQILQMQEFQLRIQSEQAKRKAEELKIELELDEAKAQALTSALEREYALRLVAAKRTYLKELEAAASNAALRLQAERKFQLEKFAIEQEYARKSNVLYDAALSLAEILPQKIAAAFERNANANKDRANKAREELENIKQQEAELFDKMEQLETDMKKQRGSKKTASAKQYDDYQQQRAALRKRQKELEAELGPGTDTFFKSLTDGIGDSFTTLAETLQTRLQRVMQNLTATVSSVGGNLTTLFDSTTAAGKENFKNLESAAIEAVAVVGARLGALAAQGKLTFESFAATIGATALEIVQQLILTYTPAIFTTAIGLLGPIAGPIAAVAAIATVMGLLGVARGALSGAASGGSSAPGFFEGAHNYQGEGAIRIPGASKDPFIVRVHPGEDIFSPDVSAANRDLFKHLHERGTLDEYVAKKYAPTIERRMEQQTFEKIMYSELIHRTETARETLRHNLHEATRRRMESLISRTSERLSETDVLTRLQETSLADGSHKVVRAAPFRAEVLHSNGAENLLKKQLLQQERMHTELLREVRLMRAEFEHTTNVNVRGKMTMEGDTWKTTVANAVTKNNRQERARH